MSKDIAGPIRALMQAWTVAAEKQRRTGRPIEERLS
jgi:hypothetical protein